MLDVRKIEEEMEAEQQMRMRRHDLQNDQEFHRRIRLGNEDLEAGRVVVWAELVRKYG